MQYIVLNILKKEIKNTNTDTYSYMCFLIQYLETVLILFP